MQLKLPNPADLLYTAFGVIGPFFLNMLHKLFVQALDLSRLDYCNTPLTGLSSSSIKPLQLIQNASAHIKYRFVFKVFHNIFTHCFTYCRVSADLYFYFSERLCLSKTSLV